MTLKRHWASVIIFANFTIFAWVYFHKVFIRLFFFQCHIFSSWNFWVLLYCIERYQRYIPEHLKCRKLNLIQLIFNLNCYSKLVLVIILEGPRLEESAPAQVSLTLSEKLKDLARPEMLRPLRLVVLYFFFYHCGGLTGLRPFMVTVFQELRLTVDPYWLTVSNQLVPLTKCRVVA